MQTSPSQSYLLTSDQTFIDLVYSRLLGMAAPISGSNSEQSYNSALDGGTMTLAGVAQSIAELTTSSGAALYNNLVAPGTVVTTTPSLYNGVVDQVARLYYATLGREPDYAGLEYWANAVKGGMTLATAAAQFIASPEFLAKVPVGSSNASFVSVLYLDALGRTYDAAGMAFWTSALASGESRAQVAMAFSESSEAIAKWTGVTNTEAVYAAIAERMPTTSELVLDANGFASATLFSDAVTAAVNNGVLPVTNEIVISGSFADQSTIDLQAGTLSTVGKTATTVVKLADATGKAIGEATATSLHVFNLSAVTYGKGLVIKGTQYDDTITLPAAGATVQPMGGNDTLLLPAAAASTIVLGSEPALLNGVAAPYANGFDVIGAYDANNVLQGGFKLAGKSSTPDILNVDNFLGTTGAVTKVLAPVDLDVTPAAGPPPVTLGAKSSGSVLIIETQHPEALTLADLNLCFSLPVPTPLSVNSQLNYVAIAISNNASSNAYVYAVQHLGTNNTFSAAGGDQITAMVELVGVTTNFAGTTLLQGAFTAANIV